MNTMTKQYDEAVWQLLENYDGDGSCEGPWLPEFINSEPGGPEAYFMHDALTGIAEARKALDQLEAAINVAGAFEDEDEWFNQLQADVWGIEIAIQGRVKLGNAACVDGLDLDVIHARSKRPDEARFSRELARLGVRSTTITEVRCP